MRVAGVAGDIIWPTPATYASWAGPARVAGHSCFAGPAGGRATLPLPKTARGAVYVVVHNERPASHYEPWAACHRGAGAGLLWEDARASLASGGVVSSIPAMMASQKQRAENVR